MFGRTLMVLLFNESQARLSAFFELKISDMLELLTVDFYKVDDSQYRSDHNDQTTQP